MSPTPRSSRKPAVTKKPATKKAATKKAATKKAATKHTIKHARDKPSIRFTYPESLHRRVLAIQDSIENADDPTIFRGELSELIIELMEAGMQDFFLNSLARLDMGVIINQSALLGAGSVVRIMTPILRNIIGRMDAARLRQVAEIMREMMA